MDAVPRLVCVGSNIESMRAIEALIAARVDIAAIVTLSGDAVSKGSDYVDLRPIAENHNIPVVECVDINSYSVIKSLRELAPDYIFVTGWSQLLRDDVLRIPRKFVVGSHPTALPRRRGRAPIPWTIVEGCSESAITLFKMTPGVDDGPILLQRKFSVSEGIYAVELYQRVAEELARGFVDLYWKLKGDRWEEVPQCQEEATYRAKRVPEDGLIDFVRPANEIHALVRAVSKPYPGAYVYYCDKVIHVWKTKYYGGAERRGSIGQVLTKEGQFLVVQAADSPICLGELSYLDQPYSLRNIQVGDLLNYRIIDEIAALRSRVADLERTRDER